MLRIEYSFKLSTSPSRHEFESCRDFPSSNEPARLLTQSCRRGGDDGVVFFILFHSMFMDIYTGFA